MQPKINTWREKAKSRSKKIQSLKKRIKELEQSRGNWKQKYMELKKQYKQDVLGAKMGIKKQDKNPIRAKHHHYDIWLMKLVLCLLQSGQLSYRKCVEVLKVFHFCTSMEVGLPSYSTIRYWEQKVGLYRLTMHEPGIGETSWVLLIDESVSIGQERMLLLLGVRLDQYAFQEALKFEDTVVLSLGVKSSWKHADIEELIAQLIEQGYQFAYAVADRGNNLTKALKNKGIIHIKDCGHFLSNLLEKRYKNDVQFNAFCKACAQLRRKGILSKYAHLISPVQRAQARFLNLDELFVWAQKIRRFLQAPPQGQEQFVQHLEWINDYKQLIDELSQVLEALAKIKKQLKTFGVSQESSLQVNAILNQAQLDPILSQSIKAYCLSITEQIMGYSKVICSSDIIESYFGKFKNHSQVSISHRILSVVNYSKVNQEQEIKKAMQTIKIINIAEWKQLNLTPSSSQIRRKILQKTG